MSLTQPRSKARRPTNYIYRSVGHTDFAYDVDLVRSIFHYRRDYAATAYLDVVRVSVRG